MVTLCEVYSTRIHHAQTIRSENIIIIIAKKKLKMTDNGHFWLIFERGGRNSQPEKVDRLMQR